MSFSDLPLSALLAGLATLYNLVVFVIYAIDKDAARGGQWRVRESTLLWLALLGGGAGAFAAQRLLRHKTRKRPFTYMLPALLILQAFAACLILLNLAVRGQNSWP